MKGNILIYTTISLLVILIGLITWKQLTGLVKALKMYFFKIIQLKVSETIEALSKIELKLLKNEEIKNELNLEDLTANLPLQEDKNQLNTYINSLNFAIKNQDVINIALTGGFGSGKSTIINEFIKKNRGNEYLQISLANFNEKNQDEKLIETSIVQQILYFEKKKNFKESSFNRIDFTKKGNKVLLSVIIVIWLYSIIYLFFDKINDKMIFFDMNFSYSNYIFLLIFMFGLTYLIYKSFDTIRNFKLSKLSNSSIEVVNENTEKQLSVFNRNIEEIIYFFEKTNTNIVIIEDIDRFSEKIAIRLFSKIRELSILIKQAKDIKQNVKFIYTVKDEINISEKTKFFDFIIPVIPIIDYSNSKNKFFEKLKPYFEQAKPLDKIFISEVSNYVYDMRKVISICNEFKLYNEILKKDKTDLDKNRLFSLILYKNLFPQDFAKIQKNESNLHKVFQKDFNENTEFGKKIQNILEEIDAKETELQILKYNLKNHIIKDIIELRTVYLFKLLTEIFKLNERKVLEIEGVKDFQDLTSDENFEKIKTSTKIMFEDSWNGKINTNISFKQLEKIVNKESSYSTREQQIVDFNNNKVNEIVAEIAKLHFEINSFQKLSLSELYSRYRDEVDSYLDDIYKLNTETDFQKINLIKYLIKYNCINEDFVSYISYFYPGSLSSRDHNLLIRINQNDPTIFDEEIDNINSLIKDINPLRFKNDSVLIYQIFDFLLKNSHIHSDKYDFFFEHFYLARSKTLNFLRGYIERLEILNDHDLQINFYYKIIKWSDFYLFADAELSNELKRSVLFQLISKHCSTSGIEILISQNKNELIQNAIANDSRICNDIYGLVNIDIFIELLKKLNVKFYSIDSNENINDLLHKIYKNELYKINVDNVKLFSQIDNNYHFDEIKFTISNYTFLSSNQDTFLYKYLTQSSNINEYIEKVYLKLDQNISEDSNLILGLLENTNIEKDNKLYIIERGFSGKINSFREINDNDIFKKLLKNNKIVATWENILEYYESGIELYIDEYLSAFLNLNYNNNLLDFKSLNESSNELFDNDPTMLDDFLYSIINSNEITDIAFESIFDFSDDKHLQTEKITIESRIPFLIKQKNIKLNQEEFSLLKARNEDYLIKLLEHNQDEFVSNISNYELEISIIHKLIISDLSITNTDIIISKYESDILLNNNQTFLNDLASYYLVNKINLPSWELIEHLLKSTISLDDKIALFNLDLPTHSDIEDSRKVLRFIGGKLEDIFEGNAVELPNIEPYLEFANNLMEINIINSRSVSGKGKVLTIYPNKP
jgi:hypothetical protein